MIVLLWFAADGAQVLQILSKAQPLWLIAGVATLLCQTLLSAVRWRITAGALGQRLPLHYAIKEYFTAQVVNQAVPGAVVGDAARAVRARTHANIVVSGQAVLIERLAGQIAMFLTMACAFLVTWFVVGGLEWPVEYAAPLGLTIGIGVMLLAIVVSGYRYPILLGHKLSRVLKPFYAALLAKPVLAAQVALGIGITVCNLAAFGFCAWAVGVSLSVTTLLAIVPVILFSMLIPFTVSGWGVREGAAAMLLPLAGTTISEGVAVSVMYGCALLLSVLPGLITVAYK